MTRRMYVFLTYVLHCLSSISIFIQLVWAFLDCSAIHIGRNLYRGLPWIFSEERGLNRDKMVRITIDKMDGLIMLEGNLDLVRSKENPTFSESIKLRLFWLGLNQEFVTPANPFLFAPLICTLFFLQAKQRNYKIPFLKFQLSLKFAFQIL